MRNETKEKLLAQLEDKGNKKLRHVTLSFRDTALLEARKSLFLYGISLQDFFAYIVVQLGNRDEKIFEFLKEYAQIKKEHLFNNEETKELKIEDEETGKQKFSADLLYNAIKDQLEKESENNHEEED